MKMVKDKQLLMGADFAGYPLKEAIKEYLEKKGWTITDVGVKADSDPNDTELMFHRIGLRVGAMISEKEFERAMIFCGTGMGIHIAASKCPGVHAGVVESVPAAFRAITGNGVNVLALGAFYVTPELGKQCADAFLYNDFGSGWEWWPDFDKFQRSPSMSSMPSIMKRTRPTASRSSIWMTAAVSCTTDRKALPPSR